MTERLIVFAFTAVLVVLAYHAALAGIEHGWFDSTRSSLQLWFLLDIVGPSLALLLLCWLLGFFRPGRPRWADLAAVGLIVVLVALTRDAPLTCFTDATFKCFD